MCGIAGAIGDHFPEGCVARMTEALAHRGPDDTAFFRDRGVEFGFRRLAVIGLENGRQPLRNETGDLTLVCNGTIYNCLALREELEKKGHVFTTQSDCEVILHLYEEHGDDCVTRLRGMFAFALWDAPRRRLLLARDHLGQKPLFFHETAGCLLFASEPKALLQSTVVDPVPDHEGLWHLISLRYLPDERSLFRGVRKLPAGTSLTYEGGRIRKRAYWRPDFRRRREGSEIDFVDVLDRSLANAVSSHLLSDVPVGAFLSGGIDSSTLAAMMAQRQEEPLPTFSVSAIEKGFDELPFARLVAERWGFDAHEYVARPSLARHLPAMVYHLDEPSDPFAAGVYLAAREASRCVKVVLTGDGGDETFAGYERYAGQRLVDVYCLLPAALRRTLMQGIVDRIPDSFAPWSLAQRLRWLHDLSFEQRGRRYAHSLTFLRFPEDARRQLWTESARSQLGDVRSVDKILEQFETDRAEDLVDRMLYTDLLTRIPDQLLSTADRMTMAHSVEARSPFVDVGMVDLAASIPPRMKLRGRTTKHILRRVAARYVPDAVVHRPKQGFGFPLAQWMRGELAGFVRFLLNDSRFVELGIFEGAYIDELVAEHLSGRHDHSYRLWILVNLEVWHRLYFEGESVEGMATQIDELLAHGDRSAGRSASA